MNPTPVLIVRDGTTSVSERDTPPVDRRRTGHDHDMADPRGREPVTGLPVVRHTGADGVVRLTPIGEIDLDNAGCLRAAIGDAFSEPRATEVVVDLVQVSFLACAGVSALVDGRRTAASGTKSYAVVNAHGVARKVLILTGLLDQLTHRASRMPAPSPPGRSAPARPRLPGIGDPSSEPAASSTGTGEPR